MRADDLTPVAQDYLKTLWSATEWGGDPVTPAALADRFGTSRANVTATIKRLAAQGLLEHEPYRPVALTAEGRRCAVEMVRRHRLLETFLVAHLDYTWDEVHEEAEQLEHAASPRLVERIDAALGHPARDPHGDPIPDADGRMRSPGPGEDGVGLLSEVGPGERCTVLRVADDDPTVLHRADALGIRPGAELVVTADLLADAALAADVQVRREG